MALEDIKAERLKKLSILKEKGINPYPAETNRGFSVAEALKKFSALAKNQKQVALAGRLMAKREHGGSAFMDLKDGDSQIQLLFKKDVLPEQYDSALELLDIGDFMEAEGVLFETQRGERTLEVRRWKMLAKSLLPLPEKWHGLQDIEERFRKRYLDILMNPEVRERFELRSQIVSTIRQFLDKNGFMEVETPLLHPLAGGALAKPFVTHHNALDADLYLRIAPELYLKRLLVAGWEKVYELGRNFRNEGLDPQHNPEFTMLEFYAAYWDEKKMMDFVEDLFLHLAKKFFKTAESDGQKIIFKKPFGRVSFKELLKRYALIVDYDRETRDTLATRAKQFGIEVGRHESKGKIADEIYKKICRPYLIQPTFVINHPLEISPLAKENEDNPAEVRRLQLIINGIELNNAFAELNNPLEQKKRFAEQEKERGQGEEEAHRADNDFIEALEYGMPPAAGLGMGIDRLIMFLTNMKNIKEVILFPTLRPK